MATTIQSGQSRRPLRRRRKRELLFWIKRGLQASIIGLPTLATAGTTYQFVATKIDKRKLGPAPGEMVIVGNHKLHIRCMGQGSPT